MFAERLSVRGTQTASGPSEVVIGRTRGGGLVTDKAPKGRREGMSMAGAAALIAKAKSWCTLPDPSAQALAELRLLLEHNDTATKHERVGADAAINMLRGLGWKGTSRKALNAVCTRLFGRRSYGTK